MHEHGVRYYLHARAWRALQNLEKLAYLRARAWRLLHILRHSILQILILLSSLSHMCGMTLA
jgi:hypothetical protein